MLGIAYSASIGGMATLIGTPSNTVLAGYLQKTYSYEITFAAWMNVGVPLLYGVTRGRKATGPFLRSLITMIVGLPKRGSQAFKPVFAGQGWVFLLLNLLGILWKHDRQPLSLMTANYSLCTVPFVLTV